MTGRKAGAMSSWDKADVFLPAIYQDVKCPKCSLQYRSSDRAPLLLSCGHAVCERCFGKSNSHTCTVCNEKTSILGAGDKKSKHFYICGLVSDCQSHLDVHSNPLVMRKLPTDAVLSSSLNRLLIKDPCDECGKVKSTVQCRNCWIEVCLGCFKKIHTPLAIRKHKPESLIIPAAALSCLLPDCADHPQNTATLCCVTCTKENSDTFLCMTCKIFGKHQGHELMDMASLTSHYMPEIKSAIEVLKDTVEELQDTIKKCHLFRERALQSRDLGTMKIRSFTHRLHGLLQMEEEAALARLSTFNHQVQDTLFEQQTELEKEIHIRESVLKYAELLVNGEVPSVHSSNFLKEMTRLGNSIPMPRFLRYCPSDLFKCHVSEDLEDMLSDCIKIEYTSSTLNALPEDNQLQIVSLGDTGHAPVCLKEETTFEEKDVGLYNSKPDIVLKKLMNNSNVFLDAIVTQEECLISAENMEFSPVCDESKVSMSAQEDAFKKEESVIPKSQRLSALDLITSKSKYIKKSPQIINPSFTSDLLQMCMDYAGKDLLSDVPSKSDDLKVLPTPKESGLDTPQTGSKEVTEVLVELDVEDMNPECDRELNIDAQSGARINISNLPSETSLMTADLVLIPCKFQVKVERREEILPVSYLSNILLPENVQENRVISESISFKTITAVEIQNSSSDIEEQVNVPKSLLQGKEENCKVVSSLQSLSQQALPSSDLWLNYGARPKTRVVLDELSTEHVSIDPLISYPITRSMSSSSLQSGVSCATSSLVPAKGAALLMEEHVRVTFVESPSLFYVQRSIDYEKIISLSRKLNRIARESRGINEIIPFVGKVYLGRFTQDGKWYRALVLAVLPESHEVVVKYVDYGNSETIKTSRLRECPPQYQLEQLPAFNLTCCLWEIIPARGDDWDTEAITTFCELIMDCALQLCVMSYETVNDVNRCLVDLRRPGKTVGIANDLPLSIREVLIFLEFAVYVNFSSQDKYNKNATHICKYNYPEIPFGADSVEVLLSSVRSPHDIHLQFTRSSGYLEKLMMDLQDHYNSAKRALQLDWQIYAPKIGMLCVAKYTGDGRWYRAIIEDLPGCKKVDVYYVDFGNRERLWYKQINKIADKFILLPAQAMSCSLLDMEPREDTWSVGIADLMTTIADSQDLVATFHSYENEKCFITLSICAGEYEIDFGEQLIHMDAAKCPHKKKSELSGNIYNLAQLNGKEQKSSERDESGEAETRKWENNGEPKRAKKGSPKQRDHEEVMFLAVTSPTCIHLRLSSQLNYFKEFQSSLEQKMQIEMPHAEFNPSCGDLCVIKQQHSFARVRILEIKDPKVEVHLVDCGGIQKVQLSKLLPLPEDFAITKNLSVAVSLAGVTPPGGQGHWPGVTIDRLEEILSNNDKLYVKTMGDRECHSDYDVEVISSYIKFMEEKLGGPFEANSASYISISDLLIQEGLALPDATRIFSLQANNLEDTEDEHTESSSAFSKRDSTYKEECERQLSIDEEESSNRNILDWLPCPLPETTVYAANPSYVDEEGAIYLQPLRYSRTLDMISEGQTMQFANSSPSDNDLCWCPGDPVIARFFLDNKWYRAIVLKLLNTGKVLVQFVDYGNTDKVNLSDLRRNIVYDQIPIQCCKAVLYCTEPRNLGGHWETKVLDFLHKTVVDKECIVTLMEEPRTGKPLEVQLVLKEHELDVISLLVDKLKICRRVKPKVDLEEDSQDVIIESDSFQEDFPVVCLPPLNLPSTPEEKFSVKVTAIKDPSHVYISPMFAGEPSDTKYQELLQADVIAYREFFSSVNKDPAAFQRVENPRIGAVYLGMFSTQEWYRVQILDKIPHGVTALFVDTGNNEDISLENLRECPDIGRNIPAMAVGVNLDKLEPPLGTSTLWSEDAMTAMIDCLMSTEEKYYLASVVSAGSPAQVELYHKGSKELAYADLLANGLIAMRKLK